MAQDLDLWLNAIVSEVNETPDLQWATEITEEILSVENSHFQSFHNFAAFPTSVIPLDLSLEGDIISKSEEFLERAKYLLANLSEFSFSDIGNCTLIAFALHNDASLLQCIRPNSPVIPTIWCLSQCVDKDVQQVLDVWRNHLFHPPPLQDRVDLQAVLLILEYCVDKLELRVVPYLTSDEYETIFALAYCSERSQVRVLASFILPQIQPFLTDSPAAHLLVRRMLPYCAMENKNGRKVAMQAIEEILGHHMRFPSAVSTWITLHPFCVAGSNNLLVDLQTKGLVSRRMKNLVKQLMRINKRLLKNRIKMTDDIHRSLPRALWRVPFPPPKSDVLTCNDTCLQIYKSMESKMSVLIPALMIFIVVYLLYVLI